MHNILKCVSAIVLSQYAHLIMLHFQINALLLKLFTKSYKELKELLSNIFIIDNNMFLELQISILV